MATWWWSQIRTTCYRIPDDAEGGHCLGSHVRTRRQEIWALFWHQPPPWLGAKHLTSLPREPWGASLSRMAQNTLTPAVEIWERHFANTAENRTCSARRKVLGKIYMFYFKRELEFRSGFTINFSNSQRNQLIFQFSCFIIQRGVWGEWTGL